MPNKITASSALLTLGSDAGAMRNLREALETRLAAHGVSGYRRDRKGRHVAGMIALLGDLPAMNFLRDERLLNLFSNARLRKGGAFTHQELKPLIHLQADLAPHTADMRLQWLIDRFVFQRGYRLPCERCALEGWYELPELADIVLCKGCRATLSVPPELRLSFRLNPLFIEGFNQGAITMLLTLLHFHERRSTAFAWEAGLVLDYQGTSVELDIVMWWNDQLIVAECKDNYTVDDQLVSTLRAHYALTERLIAADQYFATLHPSVPPAITALGFKPLPHADLLRLITDDPQSN